MKEILLKISDADNVAVALRDIRKGEMLECAGEKFAAQADVKFGHKVALADIPAGADVVKYGHRIGRMAAAVLRGGLVDETNLRTALGERESYFYSPTKIQEPQISGATFNGYVRANGEVGVRNELWIVPLVSCVNCLARELENRFRQSPLCAHTDGVFAITQPYGCSQLGCDHANTRKILADLCVNPNAGGVLVLALGCENNKMSDFKLELQKLSPDFGRIRFLESQSVPDELDAAQSLIRELLEEMKSDSRSPAPLSKLKVGMKCGGSDAFSGITANVLIGKFADELTARGGSCALCEVPEMFGAETLLMNRAKSRAVFDEIVDMINSFKNYFVSNGMPVYENPSPGNKAGGISTLEEKSLGCVQKGGTGAVNDVVRYGGRIKCAGLTLLESPGNDPVAATALASAGCQIILFSTGRGTPFSSIVPTLKISSNSALFDKKRNWIDFDAGTILDGKPLAKLSREFFDSVMAVANGRKTKAEENGYREIAIFKTGITL